MDYRSTYQVNCNGAAQILCYFCGTDELDLDFNTKSMQLFLKKRNVIDARYKMSEDAELS